MEETRWLPSLTFTPRCPNLSWMFRPGYIVIPALVLAACATHPTISPLPLKQGESFMGYTISVENVVPLVFYRYGLTDKFDVGLRVGMPAYGTGIDASWLLASKPYRSDVLNVSYSFNANSNIDYTYYRVNHKTKFKKKKGIAIRRLRYYGLRGMVIRNGMNGWRSNRFGILIGGGPAVKGPEAEQLPRTHRFQWELGYFHDFSSMPLLSIFKGTFDHTADPRFEDYPHSENGLPTEFSRLTGLTFRLSFPLTRKVAAEQPPLEEGQ